jgi:hypothetical protein
MLYTLVNPVLRRQRQEDQMFEASLSYIERSCFKRKKERKETHVI